MNGLPDIDGSVHVSIPEHQVLLNFNSDADAEAWLSWWYALGQDLYEGTEAEDEWG